MSLLLYLKCLVTKRLTDISLCKYPDDLCKITLLDGAFAPTPDVTEAHALADKVQASNASLDKHLRLSGHQHNVPKQVHVGLFFGGTKARSPSAIRDGNSHPLFQTFANKMRYVGPLLAGTLSFQPQLNKNIANAPRSYYSLGGFWKVKRVLRKFKRVCFVCYVANTMLDRLRHFYLHLHNTKLWTAKSLP